MKPTDTIPRGKGHWGGKGLHDMSAAMGKKLSDIWDRFPTMRNAVAEKSAATYHKTGQKSPFKEKNG